MSADYKLMPGSESAGSISVRDYFMAHAPQDPQEWFEPVVPPPPLPVPYLRDRTPEENHELNGLNEYLGIEDLTIPRVIEYAKAVAAQRIKTGEWSQERGKQRFVQWPAAWADAMIDQRNKR